MGCYPRTAMATAISLPHRLQSARGRSVLLLVGCAAFVAAGLFILPEHPAAGASSIVFFGLGVVVALVQLRPGSSYLELDREGFTTCTLFRKTFYRWSDIAEFSARSKGIANTVVVMRLAPSFPGYETLRRFAKWLGDDEFPLPDTYGLPAAELAALLNDVRAKQTRPR